MTRSKIFSCLPVVGLAFLTMLWLPVQAQSPDNVTTQESPGVDSSVQKQATSTDICRALAQAAADNELPVAFLTRLIWQESRFNPEAISSKGAMGIAQFMPRTASGRGLADPFEPIGALREAASYLRELRTTFGGNLGLAAAAYNAGPGRVEGWLAGRRSLPGETRAYVRIITGMTAETWVDRPPENGSTQLIPKAVPCLDLARLIRTPPVPRPNPASNEAWGPWGVQLAGNLSEGGVLAAYERLRRQYHSVLGDRLPLVIRGHLPGLRGAAHYRVRVSESSRRSADALCSRLRALGGACIVLRNPRG